MPQNWKIYKLKELTNKIGSGATPRGGKEAYLDSGISLIRSQNVLDFSFSTDGLAFIDDSQAKALNNVTVESRDVLLNITGDSVARVCQVPDIWLPARVNQHVAIIRANQDILCPEFLLYTLLTNGNKNTLLTLASAGATRNALTKQMIEDFEITIPPLPEQRSIASILSAIDDKIELNLQMNKTLEEMATTLYKHWFKDFGPFQSGDFVDSELGMIPKGWEVKGILEIAQLLSGGTPKTTVSEYWDGDIHWVSAKDIGNGGNIYINETEKTITEVGVKNSSTKILPEDTVILVARGSVGKYGMIAKSMAMNQSCYGLYTKSEFSQGLVYLMVSMLISQFQRVAYGSVFDTITTSTFETTKVIAPPTEIVHKLKDLIDPLFLELKQNTIENQSLMTLRNTLLPKLISGEVRVKEAEKALAEVL